MDGLPLSVYLETDEKHAEKRRPIAGYRLSYCENLIDRLSSAMQECRVVAYSYESLHAIISSGQTGQKCARMQSASKIL
jgi:flagellar biosynthesis chaperone FliJ